MRHNVKLFMGLQLRTHPGDYAVSRLPNSASIPQWADGEGFVSISRTSEELSIVCLSGRVPVILEHDWQSETGWACLQLVGPFAFTLTGILLAVLEPLAAAGIGIFAISTFDTDYVMVKHSQLAETVSALSNAGHTFIS
jgi:uncharacterized protein